MKFLYVVCLLLFPLVSFAYPSSLPRSYKFRVYLSDKGETGYSLDDPSRFLSRQALERKERQKVAVDEADLPISRDYFTLVEQSGGKVVAHSKWFSTLVVEVKDSLSITQVEALSFVDSVKYVWQGVDLPYSEGPRPRLEEMPRGRKTRAHTPFGASYAQFKMHNATGMFNAGYRGKGIGVGVIDAGFTNFDVIPWFDSVELRGYKDFVPGGSLFASSDHGTKVLSTMAVNRPGRMVGSAPDAAYWLLRSEDVASEFPVEEDYWVQAIEYADSVGVDVVNSSLGYNHFNDSSLNYTHDDLTGNVSIMSRAADKASRKGMIVVVSAGNEGNKVWQKSTPPGDAEKALAVGAVGVDSVIASFSSRGEMADGRVKPDLVSVGKEAVTIGQNGLVGSTNGTSLSSPFLAGLIASLWSINPELHREELVGIVKRSSDRYASPDSVYGQGIPDFGRAVKEVLETLEVHPRRVTDDGWLIEPDPSGNYWIKATNPPFSGDAYKVRLLDEAGLLLSEHTLGASDAVSVPLPGDDEPRYLYFVVEEPFRQRTYRVRL